MISFLNKTLRTTSSSKQFYFNFVDRLKLVSEGGYGTQREDGTWNGMLGEIISGVCKCILEDSLKQLQNSLQKT